MKQIQQQQQQQQLSTIFLTLANSVKAASLPLRMNQSGGRRNLPAAVLHGLVSCVAEGYQVLRSQ